jgi:hypothetical protein
MTREDYINEILEYQDILSLQIKSENEIVCDFGISEKEQVYNDINDYAYNDFYVWDEKGERPWTEEEFIDYIKYLEKLTGLTKKIDLEEVE